MGIEQNGGISAEPHVDVLKGEDDWYWAGRWLISYEKGEAADGSYNGRSYKEIVSSVDWLARNQKIPSNWRDLVPLDLAVLKERNLISSASETAPPPFVWHESGVLRDSDTSWSLEARGQEGTNSFSDITTMDHKALHSKAEVGAITPPLEGKSFVYGIRSATPDGSVRMQLKLRDVKEQTHVPIVTSAQAKRDRATAVRVPFHTKGIPVPPGYKIVGSPGVDGEAWLVGTDPQTPLVTYNLDAAAPRTFFIQPSGELTAPRELFIPSRDEQMYWSRVMPLPADIVQAALADRQKIIGLITAFMADSYYYVCSDPLGAFLGAHKDELPLLIDELKLGHCDLLAWAASAYFRQLGVPTIMTSEMITAPDGAAFMRDVGHARLAIMTTDGRILFIDPTTFVSEPEQFAAVRIRDKAVRKLETQYVKAAIEPEKRVLLREFRDAFIKYATSHSSTDPRTIISGLLDYQVGDAEETGGAEPAPSSNSQPPTRQDTRDRSREFRHIYDSSLGEKTAQRDLFDFLDGHEWNLREVMDWADMEGIDERTITSSHTTNYRNHALRWQRVQLALLAAMAESGKVVLPSDAMIDEMGYFGNNYKILPSTNPLNLRECGRIDPESGIELLSHVKRNVYSDYPDGFLNHGILQLSTDPLTFTRDYLSGMDGYEYSDLFRDLLMTNTNDFSFEIFGQLEVDTQSKDKKQQERIAVTAHDLQIFIAELLPALNDPAQRAALSQRFGLPDQFWLQYARSLMPIDAHIPKDTIERSASAFLRGSLERNGKYFDACVKEYAALRDIFYLPPDQCARIQKSANRFFDSNAQRGAAEEIERADVERYNPHIHRASDIIWSKSTVPGQVYARRRLASAESPAMHVVLDTKAWVIQGFDNYFGIINIVQALKNKAIQERRGVYVTNHELGAYIRLDQTVDVVELVTVFMASSFLSKDGGDFRVTTNDRVHLPENLFYVSDHRGRVEAIRYQLGSNVRAVTYEDAGLMGYPLVQESWVEEVKADYF